MEIIKMVDIEIIGILYTLKTNKNNSSTVKA